MTYKEFKEYVESYKSLFENQQKVLEKYETDGDIQSLPFCISYAALLEDRLRYCFTCSAHYRAVAGKKLLVHEVEIASLGKGV